MNRFEEDFLSKSIELRQVTKKYGAFTALQGIDLQIHAGEFVGIVGKS